MPIGQIRIVDQAPIGPTAEQVYGQVGGTARELQKRYDQAQQAIANSMIAAGQQKFVDTRAREDYLNRQQQRFKEIAVAHRDDLSRALPDVQRAIAANAQDPYLNFNRYQVQQLQQENKLKDEYGPDAIVRSNVAGVRLRDAIDPATGAVKDENLQLNLRADVQKASDYVRTGQEFVAAIKPDSFAGALRRNPDFKQFLERGDVTVLDDKKMLELVNTPEVYEGFVRSTTAGIDNRAQVRFDPRTGTNMFTGPATDPRFASGASQYLYGLIRQLKQQKRRVSTITDTDYLDRLRLARRKAEEREAGVRGITTQKITEITPETTKFEDAKSDMKFDEKGNLKAEVKPQFQAGMLPGMEFPDRTDDLVAQQTAQNQANRKMIDDLKTSYPELKDSTDKYVIELAADAEKNLRAQERLLLHPGSAYDQAVGPKLMNSLDQRKTVIETADGDIIELPRKHANEVYAALGFKSKQEFEAMNKNPKTFMSGMRLTAPAGSDLGSLPAKMTLMDESGKEVNMWVEQDDPVKEVAAHLDNVYQGIGKQSTITDMSPTPGKMYTTVISLSDSKDKTKRGFQPTTYEHSPAIYFDGQLYPTTGPNALSSSELQTKLNEIYSTAVRGARTQAQLEKNIAKLTNNSVSMKTHSQMVKESMGRVYDLGKDFVEQAVAQKSSYQLDKSPGQKR